MKVFGSVVMVVFQIAFRVEPIMFFHFLKIIFYISTSKRSKKYKPYSILIKIKIIEIFLKTGSIAVPNGQYVFEGIDREYCR